MESSEKRSTLIGMVGFPVFILGLLFLSKIFDPYTIHEVKFKGEQRTVAVFEKRQAVKIGNILSMDEVFKHEGVVKTNHYFGVPRRGYFITTRESTVAELALFHQFF